MAATTFLEIPSTRDLSTAQAIVKAAPQFINSQKRALRLPYPLNLLINNESQEKWIAYENILIASIQTGDYTAAKDSIEALTERFGKLNEHVIILRGMYDEAMASGENELRTILKRYDEIIIESPTMFGVRKRRIALLKSMNKIPEAIASLVELLDISPTDAEAWTELADLYQAHGALDQTVFCLEEVLLVMPNAWNIHAKLGEVLFTTGALQESVRRFCRSVELSSEYLRGYYGLKMTTDRLLKEGSQVDSMPKSTVERLNELATTKLAEIVRKSKADEQGWNGYARVEIVAAETLLNKHGNRAAR